MNNYRGVEILHKAFEGMSVNKYKVGDYLDSIKTMKITSIEVTKKDGFYHYIGTYEKV